MNGKRRQFIETLIVQVWKKDGPGPVMFSNTLRGWGPGKEGWGPRKGHWGVGMEPWDVRKFVCADGRQNLTLRFFLTLTRQRLVTSTVDI